MKALLSVSRRARGDLQACVLSILAAVVLVFSWILVTPIQAGLPLAGWGTVCPLKSITGIPCPFCGLTRGTGWMLHGRWDQAWQSNILSPLSVLFLLVFLGYYLCVRLAGGRAVSFSPPAGLRRAVLVLGILLVLISWAANLVRWHHST